MRKRFVALCVSACMFTTLFGGTMVHAADANQVTTPTQQEKNGDENEKEDIPDMQEPSDPDKVETPDVTPDENDPDKEEEPEIKPEEPEAKPEEPDKKEESNKDEDVDPSLPDTESTETDLDDKDACIGIDGEPEPYEMAENMRATTIPGTWIQAADGRWWYKHNNGTYTKNGWEYISGKWYYFDGSGWMMTGWINLGGKWYYLKISSPDSGSMLTGWQPLGGKWYYLKENSPDMGLMLTGWQQIGGKWYYLKTTSPDSGSMLTGWQDIGGSKYYLDGNGVMSTYAVAAYKNNKYTGTADGQAFISQLASTKYGKTSRYFPASSVKKADFYSTGEYIKYWASHGLTDGTIYGDANNVSFNVKSQSLKWSGNNLEFVFLATCSQLSSGLINKYADAMKGNKGVRAVAGYHKAAPSGMTGGDRDVVNRFMNIAKTGESVKASWIIANEQSKIGANCSVLAHGGVAQYSRFSGFPGATYTRPSGSNVFKYDVTVRESPITLSNTSVGTLNFKIDVEELANLEVPNYKLKKIDKLYTVNDAVDAMVFEEDTEIYTLSGEIGDENITYDEKEAIAKTEEWVDNAFNEFDSTMTKNPSVKEVVKTEVTDDYKEGEKGSTVAYIISFNNEIDDYKVQDEGIKVIVDNFGVKYSSIDWNDYEKVASFEGRTISHEVGYEEAISILEKEINSNTQSRSLLLNSNEDSNTVVNAEIMFSYDEESNLCIPVWHYEMEDGRAYNIKCDTGEISEV